MSSLEREQRIREDERIRINERMQIERKQEEKQLKLLRDAEKKAAIGQHITAYGFKETWVKVVTPYLFLSVLFGIVIGLFRWFNMENESVLMKIVEPLLWALSASIIGALSSMLIAWFECIEARD
ncbi:hypothetical protein [Herbaspirillum sp.]|jgi:hypothetical protein|uniref:hypothetical protein n=1 Tax=Herbaspirillum TaxID=963 RepID=UPI002583354A|nr:hypothetical protein [Herbaspirillum sp.]MCP3654576.1 hypothetical protein [Herbaspirillum sp.]MCP3948660.1 hypothetical protein [Herbaspirillum sp.]MCP4033239.1 hypothetical protein [Herbaspirillum sp.]MCP4556190.1 hypothetical protein [Herbaspirillum sp.]